VFDVHRTEKKEQVALCENYRSVVIYCQPLS